MTLIPLDDKTVLVQHVFAQDVQIGSILKLSFSPLSLWLKIKMFFGLFKIPVPQVVVGFENGEKLQVEINRKDKAIFTGYARLKKGQTVILIEMPMFLVNKQLSFKLDIQNLYN